MGFRKKQPQQAAMKAGIYGPAGSGKTATSLLCCEGIAKITGKRTAFVDTEHGSDFYAQSVPQRLWHPEAFDFDAIDTRSITDVISELKSFDTKTYGQLIIDSVSHLWDSTMNAWQQEGEVPKWAWAGIKKPYREMMHLLLTLPAHVFICGRETNKYEDGPDGESRVVGKKMRGEAESEYEPHLILRMAARRTDDRHIHEAYVEKDRSGILTGSVIEYPNYDSVCAEIIPLLGGTQAKIDSEDETAARDADALEKLEAARIKISATFRDDFSAKILMAKTEAALEKVGKEITPIIKKQMVKDDLDYVRMSYNKRAEMLAKQ